VSFPVKALNKCVIVRCGNATHSRRFLGEVLQLEAGLGETVLGKEHPDIMGSINNSANVLSRQSKYEQVEEMHRQVLRLKETVLGKEHPSTLTSMNNLALVLS
jgi:hypothetical protein